MIKVWTDAAEAGLLDRTGERSSAFLFLPQSLPARGFRHHAGAAGLVGHGLRRCADL